jgi:C-terminal processing protease CtpA/Prc
MMTQRIRWIRETAVVVVALLVAAGAVRAQGERLKVSGDPTPPRTTIHQETSNAYTQYLNLIGGASDGGAQLLGDASGMTFVTGIYDPIDQTLGATLSGLTDALRTQLNVPTGQGLVVDSLRADGPCALAGLKQYDVLLTLGGKPVASVDDLTGHLKEAGEKPVPIKLLRGGKEMTIQVRPIYRVTLGPVEEHKKEYFIGVSLNPVDDALRSQLNLSPGQGLIVTEVVKDSPSEKSGVKPNDIVLEFGSQPIDSADKLAAQVQADQDKPTTLKVLRAGKPLAIAITPAVREVKTDVSQLKAAVRFLALQDAPLAEQTFTTRKLGIDRENKSARQIEELREQVRSLQQAVEKLNATLNNPPAVPPKK